MSNPRERIFGATPALLKAVGPFIGLVAVWGLFALSAGAVFTSWDNQRLMLLQTAVVGTAAIGATLIIVCGGIDLSVGSTIALGTVVGALALRHGAPAWAAALAGPVAGAGIGFAIGTMVTGRIQRIAAVVIAAFVGQKLWIEVGPAAGVLAGAATLAALLFLEKRFAKRLELSPFIVTLGLWGAVRGAAKGLGQNQPVYPPPDSLGFIPDLMVLDPEAPLALPPGVWLLLAVAAGGAVLLNRTRLGRNLVAIGSNEATARLCGIGVDRTKVLVYTLGVACAGAASLLQLSFLSMGDPTTASGYELQVIAAAVIGGASLAGGEGSISGTLIGALIMTVVDNGCTKLGLDNWVQETVTGAIIVAAVALDRARRR